MLLTFSSAILRRGKLVQMDGSLTHSQVLSTCQDGGRVKFPTLGPLWMSKSPPTCALRSLIPVGCPAPPSWGKPLIGALRDNMANVCAKCRMQNEKNIHPLAVLFSLESTVSWLKSRKLLKKMSRLWYYCKLPIITPTPSPPRTYKPPHL